MTPIKTLKDLYDSIIADLQTEFPITIPFVGKNYLRIQAGIQAAKLWLVYLAIGKLQKNIFIDTADPEESGGTLQRFGRVKMGRDPLPAKQGQYTVTITGTVGAIIPSGQTFKSNDNTANPNKLFILDNAYTLTATTDTITVRALEAGMDSQLYTGDSLTASSPILSVNSTATVTAEAVAPRAAEDIEEYRAKGIISYRLEPQGGAPADYRLWGLDAAGVKQIYPYAASGAPNEINVFVEANIADSIDGKGTPTSAILAEVEADIALDPDTTLSLSDRSRKPLGVYQANVMPIAIKTIDITITGFEGLTADKQALIQSTIEENINLIRPFIGAADAPADRNDTLSKNSIVSYILAAVPGSIFVNVDMKVDGVSMINYIFTNGNIPYVDYISYA